jgi:outer membrane protein assembly factor BamB
MAAEDSDWPNFRGPRRDAISVESGLLPQWPPDGPKLLWTINGLGAGYSAVSISGGRLYTMGDRAAEGKKRAQYVLAFDLATRRELWATAIGPPHNDGPRCTPTLDGSLVFALGTEGDLVCLDAASGAIRWQRNLPRDFQGKVMTFWKFSESPLVDGDRLVCTPGGPEAAIVALDKKTGETLWKAAIPPLGEQGKDGAGYASMVVAEIEGVRQYIQLLGRGVVAVAADTGQFLWGYNRIANEVANIPTPIVRGNHVFVTTSYQTGSALLRIVRDKTSFKVEEVYYLGPEEFENHHGGVVLVGDWLFGGDGQNRGAPTCLHFATGEIAWKPKAPCRGSAAVLYADGHILFRYDRGDCYWVEANPREFRIAGNFRPVIGEGPAWAYPVIHDKKLYLRHGDILACYDLAAP